MSTPSSTSSVDQAFVNASNYEAGAHHHNDIAPVHRGSGPQVNIFDGGPDVAQRILRALSSPRSEEPPSTPTPPDPQVPKELEAISSEVENELKLAIMNFMSKGHAALAPPTSTTA